MTEEDTATKDSNGGDGSHKPIKKVRARTNAAHRSGGSDGSGDTSTGGVGADALKDDKIKNILENADEVESFEHFQYWKTDFLDHFRQYLNPDGIATAREADDVLFLEMQKLVKILITIKTLCNEGKITEERVTVKGQNSLNELTSTLAKLEAAIKVYWPKTQEDEEKVGYTKFELAAVLVRDGFGVYDVMVKTREYLIALSEGPLKGDKFLTPNSRSVMNFYLKELDGFCDTMADLGLYKLMDKMIDIYKVRPRKKKKKKPFDRKSMDPLSDTSDSEGEGDGKMFKRSKQKYRAVMDKGWTSGVTRQEVHAPGSTTHGDDETGLKGANGQNGVGGAGTGPGGSSDDPSGANKSSNGKGDNGETKTKEEEEEEDTDFIYYFDPVTEQIGKISRKKCIANSCMIEKDSKGEEKQEGAVEDWDGEEGKSMLIWKLKEALKGKCLKDKKSSSGK